MPTAAAAARQIVDDVDSLASSIAKDGAPPLLLPAALRALWHAGRGIARGTQSEVDTAHNIVVGATAGGDPAEQASLAWVHAHVHRIEDFGKGHEPPAGDGEPASSWDPMAVAAEFYREAGRPVPEADVPLETEWRELAEAMFARQRDSTRGRPRMRPVLIQGPMPIEADFFASKLVSVTVERVATFVFHVGTLDGFPVIVAKTGKGMENTAACTAVAIERYHPCAVINQGTAGGHDPSLHVGDIVLGKRSLNIGNFKTPKRAAGEGSLPLSWIPMDIMASEGSAGEDPDAEKPRFYAGCPALLAAANAVKQGYRRGKVVEGIIASANFWNNEVDRICWLHEQVCVQ